MFTAFILKRNNNNNYYRVENYFNITFMIIFNFIYFLFAFFPPQIFFIYFFFTLEKEKSDLSLVEISNTNFSFFFFLLLSLSLTLLLVREKISFLERKNFPKEFSFFFHWGEFFLLFFLQNFCSLLGPYFWG